MEYLPTWPPLTSCAKFSEENESVHSRVVTKFRMSEFMTFSFIFMSKIGNIHDFLRDCCRAEGKTCNDRKSLPKKQGVWGCCKPPSGSRVEPWWGSERKAPESSEDPAFYSTKQRPKSHSSGTFSFVCTPDKVSFVVWTSMLPLKNHDFS